MDNLSHATLLKKYGTIFQLDEHELTVRKETILQSPTFEIAIPKEHLSQGINQELIESYAGLVKQTSQQNGMLALRRKIPQLINKLHEFKESVEEFQVQ